MLHFFYWSCLVLVINFTVVYAQNSGPENLAPNFADYFLKNMDEKVAQTVYNVNKYHMKPALKFYAQGHLKRTLPDLKFVLRYIPNHPQALHLLGAVAIGINSKQFGRNYFQQAVHLFPDHALTFAQYGKYLMDIEEIEEAVKMLDISIKKEPKLALAYDWLEMAYTKKGDEAKSKEIGRKAKELGYKK